MPQCSKMVDDMSVKGLKGVISYDAMETIRNTNEWMGATARAMGSYPAFALIPNPAFHLLSAWGRVTERSFARMVTKPDWEMPTIAGEDGQDHIVYVEPVVRRAFGDLIHFRVARRDTMPRKVLLIAPMSGHYATLMRSTVTSLLSDCDVYVTDWHNARDIPVSEGKFDVEDYTRYLVDFIKHLGPDTNVVAVCQPAPLALAATAILAEEDPKAQPRSLTLIGGPVDPDAAATEVTDFGNRVTMGELEKAVIQSVGFKYRGAGRMVYPGLMQLSSFIAMNAESHSRAFINQIYAEARGTASDGDKHNKFYDEYLAVMDMTAEFYMSTVERIFKNLEIAKNEFTVEGKLVDIGKISDVSIMTVEGANDDISAPGQCVAALDLCSGVPADKKVQHLEPGAGHYGIFAGKSWRLNIRPLVLDFMDESAKQTEDSPKPKRRRKPNPADTDCGVADTMDGAKMAV
nr:polyhydroxyalkanoate depolymerase [Paracoccus sp. JM45]